MPDKNDVVSGTEVEDANYTVETNKEGTPEQQYTLNVDQNTAMTLKIQEFDKKIAEAKRTVADLESQRADYIYTTNINILLEQAKNQKK